MTTRWKLIIEYHGAGFSGWQRQDVDISVQQVIEDAVFKLSGERVTLHVAGRTDAGVHALGQVAHMDLQKNYPDFTIRNALNVHVRPHPVSILHAEVVSPEFHARFSAIRRHYRYVILNRPAPPAVGDGFVWHIPHELDIDAMRQAAGFIIGHHDFSSFRAANCQAKTPMRTVDTCNITRDGDRIIIDISARSFLHHMVRNIVGTLRKIGDGSWSPEYMKTILDARDRTVAGPTSPADGLFFMRVDYTETGSK
jgi:tRNA pseudouridine38-40 synthase